MNNTSVNFSIAILAGSLLALMIKLNSQLAIANSPLSASWIAHGIGALVALIIVFTFSTIISVNSKTETNKVNLAKPKWWHFCGGLPGAFTVVVAAITVNSSIGLSGTLAMGLIGQIIFGFIIDHNGWFGLVKKPLNLTSALTTLPIISGSLLLIFTNKIIAILQL